MNKQHTDGNKNSLEIAQNSEPTHLELVSDFQTIINLLCKSLNTPIAVIAYVHYDSIFICSSEPSLNEKSIDVKGTIFEQSLSSGTVNLKNVSIKEISEEAKAYVSKGLTSKPGKIIGFLAIIDSNHRNFTLNELSLLEDFAKMTAETLEKHTAAQKLQEVFTDFVHKTIHDLKNPFTTISLTTELLKRKADDAKLVTSFSQRLDNANTKVFQNLERLKSAFPLTSHNFKLNIQEINIDELFIKVKQLIKQEVITDNQLTEKIYGDHQRLAEATVQLANHLSLISEPFEHFILKAYTEESHAVIEISNVNSGKLKDFEDIANSTSLAIAKKLIQVHYGEIKVISHETAANYSGYIHLPLSTL